MDAVLLIASFAVILAGALLFTNAVEWVGHRAGLGEGAVGSLLAAVGTAMPETMISIVALLDAAKGADEVAIGAIVGAPFLLATLAMGLVGLFAWLYRRRRAAGSRASGPPRRPSSATSSSSWPSSRSPWRSPGGRRRRFASRSASPVSRPTRSTCAAPCAAQARHRTRRRSSRCSSSGARTGACGRRSPCASSNSSSGWGRWWAAPTSSSKSCSTSPKASGSRPSSSP